MIFRSLSGWFCSFLSHNGFGPQSIRLPCVDHWLCSVTSHFFIQDCHLESYKGSAFSSLSDWSHGRLTSHCLLIRSPRCKREIIAFRQIVLLTRWGNYEINFKKKHFLLLKCEKKYFSQILIEVWVLTLTENDPSNIVYLISVLCAVYIVMYYLQSMSSK